MNATTAEVWARPLPMTELQQWALDAEDRGVWPAQRQRAYPLVAFPDHHIEDIRRQVDRPHKPAYWLDLGLAQIPSRSFFEWHWQRGIVPGARRDARPAIPAHVRKKVMERDGLVCQICLLAVEITDVHLDHIKPWSKGGAHSVANLRVTHSRCNIRKAARWDGADD